MHVLQSNFSNRGIRSLMRCGQLWRLAVAGSEYPLSATLSRGNPRGGGHKREAFKEGHRHKINVKSRHEEAGHCGAEVTRPDAERKIRQKVRETDRERLSLHSVLRMTQY